MRSVDAAHIRTGLELDPQFRPDVIVGGPPCQGFSHVGFRSKRARTGYRLADDRRNLLWKEIVKAARELRPRLVVMENVPGMSSAQHRDVLQPGAGLRGRDSRLPARRRGAAGRARCGAPPLRSG